MYGLETWQRKAAKCYMSGHVLAEMFRTGEGEKVVWAGDVSHTHESEIGFQENTKYEHNFRDLLFVVVNFDERIQLIFDLESQIGT